jgi:hypothetical protein
MAEITDFKKGDKVKWDNLGGGIGEITEIVNNIWFKNIYLRVIDGNSVFFEKGEIIDFVNIHDLSLFSDNISI